MSKSPRQGLSLTSWTFNLCYAQQRRIDDCRLLERKRRGKPQRPFQIAHPQSSTSHSSNRQSFASLRTNLQSSILLIHMDAASLVAFRMMPVAVRREVEVYR